VRKELEKAFAEWDAQLEKPRWEPRRAAKGAKAKGKGKNRAKAKANADAT
jgi:hypothetical protein